MVGVDRADARPDRVAHRGFTLPQVLSTIDQRHDKARNEDEALRVLHPAEIVMIEFSKCCIEHAVGVDDHHEDQEEAPEPVEYPDTHPLPIRKHLTERRPLGH